MASGTFATATSTAEELTAKQRLGVYFYNKSTTAAEIVWFNLSGEDAVVGEGIRLAPEEEKFFGTESKAFLGHGISFISESGTPSVAYDELVP